jgi:glycosyltransferase involved in cell wall biosynthesis
MTFGPTKPVLFVTNHVPPERVGAFAALHRRLPIELAIFGGRSTHAATGVEDPGVPHRHVSQDEIARWAAARGYRAVVCGTAGRLALPAAWLGARAARTPFVLWTALWAHPRTPAHLLAGAPLMAALYRDADAVVAYGPHVAAFVKARGASNLHIAPQAVDNAFWSARVEPQRTAPFLAVFLGRPTRGKGAAVLLDAWRQSGLGAPAAALVLVGVGTGIPRGPAGGAVAFVGPQPAQQVRNFLAAADVCVVPSLRTRSFREPWGLIANEAMNQSTPVIASDEVGAVAGGLVRHERNGLVVPAGDVRALAAALRRMHDDRELRAQLGANARRDVAAYTFEAWASGFETAINSVGPRAAARRRPRGSDHRARSLR